MNTSTGEWTQVQSNEALLLPALRPGDIILSRPNSLESTLIAFFGRSSFSHAQVVVPEDSVTPKFKKIVKNIVFSRREESNLILEATTDVEPSTGRIVGGVGFRRLPLRYLCRKGASPFEARRVSPLSSYKYLDVFRHVEADTPKFQVFVKDFVPQLCHRYVNEPYATLSDLACVSSMPWTVETLGSLIKIIPESPRSGLFCSQLVASIFSEGGFPLTPHPPVRTRPEDIARADALSCITKQTRVRIETDDALRTYAEYLQECLPNIDKEIPGIVANIQDVGEEYDFGRTSDWMLRDDLDVFRKNTEQLSKLISSIDDFNTLVKKILEESGARFSKLPADNCEKDQDSTQHPAHET